VTPTTLDLTGPRLELQPVTGLALLSAGEPRFAGPRAVAKASLDALMALVGLLVLSPLMLIAALAVLIGDGGPVLHRQDLVGRNGSAFTGWSLRCTPQGPEARPARSSQDSGAASGQYQLSYTRVGRLLRRTGLDQAPRLVNVLAGQMSMVGPKPLPFGSSEAAGRRPAVRPGITGPWLIDGFGAQRSQVGRVGEPADGRSRDDTHEAALADLYYVRDWSVVGDIAIILRSIKLLLSGRYVR
jgi:lipopolysaccharide/colanic/teichoic acid biosynthesis glycosyltransferase